MKNLSITQKLIGSFGAVFIFIASFGLFIWFSFSNLSYERSNVGDWVQSAVNVSEISKNLSDLHRAVNIRVMAMGKPDAARFKDEQENFIKGVETHFESYKTALDNTTYDDEAEQQRDLAIYNNDVKLWENYKAQVRRLDVTLAANDVNASVEILRTDMDKAFNEFAAGKIR